MPEISIIIPVYNVEEFLSECLDSVLAQTFVDFEAICVNDGSPDNSFKILEDYAKKDSRIKIINQENKGLSGARNTGIRNSQGKYIFFLDSDDYVHPQALEILHNAIQSAKTKICSCVFVDGTSERYSPIKNNFDVENIAYKIIENPLQSFTDKHNIPLIVWNKLYDKNLFENISFVEGVCFEDEIFTPMILDKCDKISVVAPKLYYYYQNNNSISKSSITEKKLFDYLQGIKVLDAHFQHKLQAIRKIKARLIKTVLKKASKIDKDARNRILKELQDMLQKRIISYKDMMIKLKIRLFLALRRIEK